MAQIQQQPYPFPPMNAAEEDALIHSRLMNDERVLRRVARRVHAVAEAGAVADARAKEREALLDDLAAFQAALHTRALVCDAELRQVQHYENERRRIDVEQEGLRAELVQLKHILEIEQVNRKRKLEYDQIAEKINAHPPRGELTESITSLEEEIASIETQLDAEHRAMVLRRTAFDSIVTELQTLRLMGKEPELEPEVDEQADVDVPDARGEDDERDEERDDENDDDPRRKRDVDGASTSKSAVLNPLARPFKPRMLSDLSGPGTPIESPTPATEEREEGEEGSQEDREAATDGDIEMGEVVEIGKDNTTLEELEEGETSPLTPLSSPQ